MKKSFIIVIALAMSSINSVFPVKRALSNNARNAERIRMQAHRLVRNAKDDIRFELQNGGFITPLTQHNIDQAMLFCNHNGYQGLSLNLARFLRSEQRAAERIAERVQNPPAQRRLNFDDANSSE